MIKALESGMLLKYENIYYADFQEKKKKNSPDIIIKQRLE